jgi:hypothetical protein
MSDVNPGESLEIEPGVFRRLGDCTGSEIEAAIRLLARKRIDRAWIDEQAAGRDQGDLTIARRFFANTTEAERDLIAYWQMVKLVEENRLHLTEGQGVNRSIDAIAPETLIDQALATVAAVESLGPRDQISLTREQALVWAIYLRAIERHRGLASEQEIARSVEAAREGGISADEIEAAIASADLPEARQET